MNNCKDCQHYWHGDVSPQGPFHHMCRAPQLMDVMCLAGRAEASVARCNETRAFKFACASDAMWFEPATQPRPWADWIQNAPRSEGTPA